MEFTDGKNESKVIHDSDLDTGALNAIEIFMNRNHYCCMNLGLHPKKAQIIVNLINLATNFKIQSDS